LVETPPKPPAAQETISLNIFGSKITVNPASVNISVLPDVRYNIIEPAKTIATKMRLAPNITLGTPANTIGCNLESLQLAIEIHAAKIIQAKYNAQSGSSDEFKDFLGKNNPIDKMLNSDAQTHQKMMEALSAKLNALLKTTSGKAIKAWLEGQITSISGILKVIIPTQQPQPLQTGGGGGSPTPTPKRPTQPKK
jgi:hypothetical protein